jgi:hypothetical protein
MTPGSRPLRADGSSIPRRLTLFVIQNHSTPPRRNLLTDPGRALSGGATFLPAAKTPEIWNNPNHKTRDRAITPPPLNWLTPRNFKIVRSLEHTAGRILKTRCRRFRPPASRFLGPRLKSRPRFRETISLSRAYLPLITNATALRLNHIATVRSSIWRPKKHGTGWRLVFWLWD